MERNWKNMLKMLLLTLAVALLFLSGSPGVISSAQEADGEDPGLVTQEVVEEDTDASCETEEAETTEDAAASEQTEKSVRKKAKESTSAGVSAKAGTFNVKLARDTFTYTGSDIELPASSITVTESGQAVDASNYVVAYSNNRNVGTATLVVSGKGGYEGYYGQASFTIVQANISQASVTLAKTLWPWTGKAIQPGVTVRLGTVTLVRNTDYTVAYDNNVNQGTATVTVTGTGNYTGTKQVYFTIKKQFPLTKSTTTVKLSTTTYTYNGKVKKPGVVVRYKTKKLVKGRDYTVSYEDNKNAGTGYVFITGKGDYTEGVQKTFTIKKAASSFRASISATTIELKKTAKITVKNKKGTVTYSSGNTSIASVSKTGIVTGKKAGTCYITVKDSGSTNYSGKSIRFKVTVANMDISGSLCKVTLSRTHYIYDGSYKRPSVTVKYNGTTLKNGTDYTYAYYNNKNAGKAYVLISGKGKYNKSRRVYYTIEKSTQDSFKVSMPEYHSPYYRVPYQGTAQIYVYGARGTVTYTPRSPSYTKHLGGGLFKGLTKTNDYVTIAVRASGDSNYYAKTIVLKVRVY